MDDLALRLASGEPPAFETLYDLHADRVHRYLVVRLGSRTDADDVLQETFVHLARTRRKLASVNNLTAYVFAAARNEASRLLERRSREAWRRAERADQCLLEEAIDDLAAREAAEWVTDALQRLGADLREVLELKAYAGLTFREIGAVTGLPQGTVATRYRRALEALRRELVEERE
jgi:RNA polymerase sigma-70 factor (ECF subfamily)